MGFYIDLLPSSQTEAFVEKTMPPVFWVLWVVAGFALSCMFLAAGDLLRDLYLSQHPFDLTMLAILALLVFAFFVVGLKLAGLRKFVHFEGSDLVVGFTFFGWPVWVRKIPKAEIVSLQVENHKPSPNLAAEEHNDPQYQIQGHWRLVLRTNKGEWILDRHVERGALQFLYNAVEKWRSSLS